MGPSIRLFSLALSGLLVGCTPAGLGPASLQMQVDRTLTFAQLKASPDSYRGKLVAAGGEVLSAKRLKEGTRIEVLQIPLEGSQAPGRDRTASEGRFLAIQQEFLDPATIPPGTRLTIVGEVTGSTTLPLDETDYTYPTLDIKHLTVWPNRESHATGPGPGYYSGPMWRPAYSPWYRTPYWR